MIKINGSPDPYHDGTTYIWQYRSTCCRVPLIANKEYGYTDWLCTKCDGDCGSTAVSRYCLYDPYTGHTTVDEYSDMAVILAGGPVDAD